MKQFSKCNAALLVLMLFCTSSWGQITENTYTWHAQNHSAWKIVPATPFGYVIAGNKFFTSGNTAMYFTGFDEFGGHQWTRSHESGMTLQTFWKSFVDVPGTGYFAVSQGTQGGSNKAYALMVNNLGMKFWDRVSDLPNGIQFGGVCHATNGGFVATGSSNSGQIAVVKFDPYCNIQWTSVLPTSGFGWSIAQAVGGGYVIGAGSRTVVKVSTTGAFEWSASINLPASPSGAYTYTEFEEITQIDYSTFAVTGSCFSNQHSGVYTARVAYSNGAVSWAKVNDEVNTSGTGTPVCWVNNAVIDGYGAQILTSWRRGPVSAGGTMYYQRMNLSGTNIGGVTSMQNNITVREAFMTRAHQKYVVGGTRGNLASAYSYTANSLPSAVGVIDDRSEPFVEESDPLQRVQINTYNSQPEFKYPETSRMFAAALQVFPNPTAGELNIGGALEPEALLRVISSDGRVVIQRQIQADETVIRLDLSGKMSGLYTVEMIGQNGTTVKKVLLD